MHIWYRGLEHKAICSVVLTVWALDQHHECHLLETRGLVPPRPVKLGASGVAPSSLLVIGLPGDLC